MSSRCVIVMVLLILMTGTYGEGGVEPCKPCPRNTRTLPGAASVLQCECNPVQTQTVEVPSQGYDIAWTITPQLFGVATLLGLCLGWLMMTVMVPSAGYSVAKRNIRVIIGSSSISLLLLCATGIKMGILVSAAVPGIGVAVFGIALYLREHYTDTMQWAHDTARVCVIVNMAMLVVTLDVGSAYITMISLWCAISLILISSRSADYVTSLAISSTVLSILPFAMSLLAISASYVVCYLRSHCHFQDLLRVCEIQALVAPLLFTVSASRKSWVSKVCGIMLLDVVML